MNQPTLNISARAPSEANTPLSLNDRVLAAVKTMPSGGQYKTSAEAFAALERAIVTDQSRHLLLLLNEAKPNFCSAATYLIFLAVLDQLNREDRLPLTPAVVQGFLVKNQEDGSGVWGRWNANGPGTARLFHELGLGRNFTSFEEGQPGDFLKIFWTEKIGADEFGHSVIYLGSSGGNGSEEMVTFWSSNVPDGFGHKAVPKSKIRRAIFSRLENPLAISGVTNLPPRDDYLAAMLRLPSTEEEAFKMVGIPPSSRNQVSTESR